MRKEKWMRRSNPLLPIYERFLSMKRAEQARFPADLPDNLTDGEKELWEDAPFHPYRMELLECMSDWIERQHLQKEHDRYFWVEKHHAMAEAEFEDWWDSLMYRMLHELWYEYCADSSNEGAKRPGKNRPNTVDPAIGFGFGLLSGFLLGLLSVFL